MKRWLALLASVCFVGAVTVEWNTNPEPDVYGYRVYYGHVSHDYTKSIDVLAPTTTLVIPRSNLFLGGNYFAVTAFSDDGFESPFSDEVPWTNAPSKPGMVMVLGSTNAGAIRLLISEDLKTWQEIQFQATNAMQFFRTQND